MEPITPLLFPMLLPLRQILHAGKLTGGKDGGDVGSAVGVPGETGAGVGSKGHPHVPAAKLCAMKHSSSVRKKFRPTKSACSHVTGIFPAKAMVVGLGSGIWPPSRQMLQKMVSSVGIGVGSDVEKK